MNQSSFYISSLIFLYLPFLWGKKMEEEDGQQFFIIIKLLIDFIFNR